MRIREIGVCAALVLGIGMGLAAGQKLKPGVNVIKPQKVKVVKIPHHKPRKGKHPFVTGF